MIPLFSLRSKAPLPTHIEVAHGDSAYRVILKRSAKARRYTLRASAAKHEITLTMPMRGSMAQASEFAHRHGGWIAERLKKFDTIIACEYVLRRIRDFLKKQASQDLDKAVERFTSALGIPARRISLKDTTSRWGSCSSSGRLNFSWRLILAPAHVLEYLAAHEVAHLKELNHSVRYWRVVASLYPDYKQAEAWLKRHGTSLHRYQ